MAVEWIAVLFITATITTAAPVNDPCHAEITQDPLPYIIGSGGTLKLTCDVINCNTTGSVEYFWRYTLSAENVYCQEKSGTVNTCTYQPTMSDTEKEVRCTVIVPGNPVATFTVTILYPPQDAPKIELAANAREPLVNGNNIRCSVSGGKPMDNTTVTFTCTNPDLPDQLDVIVGDVVTSVITVDTSRSTETNMTCNCSATWGRDPSLYNNTSSMSFATEFRAVVKNFTINGTNATTVSEKDDATVLLQCTAKGSPAPSVIITHVIVDVINGSYVTGEGRVILPSVICNDTGSYACAAENAGFPKSVSERVHLSVTCKPRPADETLNSDAILNVTGSGLSFTLEANPLPSFTSIYLGEKELSEPGNPETSGNPSTSRNDAKPSRSGIETGSPVMDLQFECVSMPDREYLATCMVKTSEDTKPGLYLINATNKDGSFQFKLHVPKDNGDPGSKATSFTVIGVSVAVPGGIIVITITVVVVVCRRRRGQKQAGRKETQRPSAGRARDGGEAWRNSDIAVLPSTMDSPAVEIPHDNVDDAAIWTGSDAATYVNAIATSRNIYDCLQLGQSESIYTGLVTSQARADAKAGKGAGSTNTEEDCYEIPAAPLGGKKSDKKH